MTWELVYTVPLTQTIRPILIERVFEKSILIVEAIAVDARPTWYKAGFLYPILNISDVGNVRNFGQAINLNKQLIEFEDLENNSYQLEFYAHSWIPSISLNFWENTGYVEPNEREILERLRLIESKLDAIENYGI